MASQRRPSILLRAPIALLAVGAVLFTVALMLSDRAPSVLRSVFGDDVARLWDRIDASGRSPLPTGADRPETDFVVHVVAWAGITLLLAVAVWSWFGLIATAITVLAGSVVVELAQGRYSDTRTVESDDVAANGLGVALGTGAAALMYLAWSALAHTLRPDRKGR